jgi:hypothetical protein
MVHEKNLTTAKKNLVLLFYHHQVAVCSWIILNLSFSFPESR